MISFIPWIEVINFAIHDPNIFFWLVASVADSVAFDLNGIKTFLAKGLSKFFIKNKSAFSNGPRSLPKNPPDCPVLCNRVLDDFILAD